MKKKLIPVMLGALAMGASIALAGCDTTTPPSISSEEEPSTSEVSSEVPGSEVDDPVSTDTSGGGTGGGTQTEDELKYPAYSKGIDPDARVVDYNEKTDHMVDDFSSTVNGKVEGLVETAPYLRVAIDHMDAENYPSTADAAIYKQARETMGTFDEYCFSIRVVEGSLSVDDLVFGVRGSDALQVYPINVADTVDSYGDPNDEVKLGAEYVDLKISVKQSLEGTEVYKNADGTDSTTTVVSTMIGFHLYVKGNVQAVIDIKEIYANTGATKTVLDDFAHEATNAGGDGFWWRDSTGYITTKSISGKGSYTIADEALKDYENVVVRMLGDVPSDIEMTATYSDETTKTVARADLKDDNNVAVVEISNGAYGSYLINLANSGIDAEKELASLKFDFKTNVSVNAVFLTNLDVVNATEYPHIDIANKKLFTDFNFTHGAFGGDWDAAISDEAVKGAGLAAILSYNEGTKTSVDGSAFVFDATELAADGYINAKVGKDGIWDNPEQYLVLSVKATEGATLDNFRFNIGNGVKYINQMVSDTGLPVTMLNDDTYPYVTEDGYTLLVIDMAKSGMVGSDIFIDMYYSGTGKLYIDEIYLADKAVDWGTGEGASGTGTNADISAYGYLGWHNLLETERYMKFTIETPGISLATIRFQNGSSTIYVKDGAIYDIRGNVIDATVACPEEGTLTVIVDLVESGLNTPGDFHIHSGGETTETGSATFSWTFGSPTASSYADLMK